MRVNVPKTIVLVVVWTAVSAAGMLTPFLPISVLAGLGQWIVLRSRLALTRGSAIAFAVAFPLGQLPTHFFFMVAYVEGFGGFDGPPEWYVAATLASGGFLAGLVEFLGLPKSWKNFAIWVPVTSLAWAVSVLGDIEVSGMLVLSAILSGVVSGLAMLALSPRRERVLVGGLVGDRRSSRPEQQGPRAVVNRQRR